MEARHTPVLVREVLDSLDIRPGGAYIDCTVGEGGHAVAVLGEPRAGSRLLGIDLDGEALARARPRLIPYGERALLVRGSFADLRMIATGQGFSPAEGVLFDLGVSSLQLESAHRGFSFSREGRLDMRFGASQGPTAHHMVNNETADRLADLIYRYGEERGSRRVARAIVAARPIETTVELASVVSAALGRRRRGIHPATQTFQALRMAVNGELENLQAGLAQAVDVLASGGRLVVISYHSLEDRLVKNFMRTEERACICPPEIPECVCGHVASVRVITRRVVRPSSQEVEANPRSRSARMRVAERL